ncbi:MAG: DUF2339 domain-containing protein [Patescibacteria group bacterium]
MEYIIFIILVALIIFVVNLSTRVSNIENILKQSPKQTASSPTLQTITATATPAMQLASQGAVTSVVAPVVQPAGATVDEFLIAWIKDNWLLKLGALLLLIGFGWLVSYAFLNNWIGPIGRITLGMVAGAFIIALGTWRMRAYVTQGSVFVVLGATVILLTAYAARSIYDFFTPTSALALMFATSAFVAFVSGTYNRKQLAIASVALAGIAPILAHSPTHDYIGLFWYLLIVVLGAVWIVVWKDFREVVTMALIVVALHSFPLLVGFGSADMPALLLFAYGFATIFYITNTAGLLRLKGDGATSDIITAAGNAFLLLVWVYIAAAEELQSLIIAAWAVVFTAGAFMVFHFSQQKVPLFLYAAIGIGYIATATAIELSGAALTIAYTLESAAVALALYGITKDAVSAQRSTLLLLGPAILSLASITSNDWSTRVFNEHFFVLAILGMTLGGLGIVFFKSAQANLSEDVRNANATLLIIGSAYAYILLWLSLHAAMPYSPDIAVMIALIVYTIVGIGTYLEGTNHMREGLRAYGGVLLCFVVGRLLIVDVWQMELTGRIITFFGSYAISVVTSE